MSLLKSLQVTLASDREVVMTRDLDAPRDLVWKAMTQPALLRRWLNGPPGWTMKLCEDDLRAGGQFRWSWQGPDGSELVMSGVYREVSPPERMVRTEAFAMAGQPCMGEQLVTLQLTARGAQTAMRITLSYQSKEARDGALASGMEQGMEYGYQRLDELLAAGFDA